jgi:hypothetical protein
MRLMQTVILSGFFGVVCTMVMVAAGWAATTRDQMMQRGGRLAPPEEL